MPNKIPPIFHEGDCHPFEGIQFSTKSVYAKIEALIEEKKMPGVTCARISLSEGKFLSHNREYLRIRRRELIFDVCAAPFGAPAFISWRLGEKPRGITAILLYLGLISAHRIKKSVPSTYYLADTNTVFKAIVKNCINQTIESFDKPDKGVRGFVELKPPVEQF